MEESAYFAPFLKSQCALQLGWGLSFFSLFHSLKLLGPPATMSSESLGPPFRQYSSLTAQTLPHLLLFPSSMAFFPPNSFKIRSQRPSRCNGTSDNFLPKQQRARSRFGNVQTARQIRRICWSRNRRSGLNGRSGTAHPRGEESSGRSGSSSIGFGRQIVEDSTYCRNWSFFDEGNDSIDEGGKLAMPNRVLV